MERGRKEGEGRRQRQKQKQREGGREGEGRGGMKGEGRWREWLPKDIPPSDQGPRKGLAAQIWTQSPNSGAWWIRLWCIPAATRHCPHARSHRQKVYGSYRDVRLTW